jgi:hypothetical protein
MPYATPEKKAANEKATRPKRNEQKKARRHARAVPKAARAVPKHKTFVTAPLKSEPEKKSVIPRLLPPPEKERTGPPAVHEYVDGFNVIRPLAAPRICVDDSPDRRVIFDRVLPDRLHENHIGDVVGHVLTRWPICEPDYKTYNRPFTHPWNREFGRIVGADTFEAPVRVWYSAVEQKSFPLDLFPYEEMHRRRFVQVDQLPVREIPRVTEWLALRPRTFFWMRPKVRPICCEGTLNRIFALAWRIRKPKQTAQPKERYTRRPAQSDNPVRLDDRLVPQLQRMPEQKPYVRDKRQKHPPAYQPPIINRPSAFERENVRCAALYLLVLHPPLTETKNWPCARANE